MLNRDLRRCSVWIFTARGGKAYDARWSTVQKPRGGTNAVLPTDSKRCVDHKVLCIADGHIKRTTADESEKGIISSKEKTIWE